MRVVERLNRILDLATQAGYSVRHEWLGGARGGCCEVAGRKILFVDVSLSTEEQLEQIADSSQSDPQLRELIANDVRPVLWTGGPEQNSSTEPAS